MRTEQDDRAPNPLALLHARLRDVPSIRVIEGPASIRAECTLAGGFPVEMSAESGEYLVSFGDGWHEHFSDADEAARCFMFGLSARCRLRVDLRGGAPHRWTVESRDGETWRPRDAMGLLLFKFWRGPETRFLRNIALG